MIKYFLSFGLLLMISSSSMAQKVPYKVVFDVTSKDTLVHQMIVRWVKGITAADPGAKLAVVFYAKSLDMVTKGKSVVADEVIKYAANKNVAFKVCEVALKSNNIDKSQLLPGVETIPDGIYEIITLQHDGWGYIKASL